MDGYAGLVLASVIERMAGREADTHFRDGGGGNQEV